LTKAFAAYLERRALHIKARTIANYKSHFASLIIFFGADKRLDTFHESDFRGYQRWRKTAGDDRPVAGNSCINHELNALAQVLALADLWRPISRYYEPLPVSNWSAPRVLTSEEEDRFLRVAQRKPEWQTAYCCCQITGNSTIAGCELRHLKLGQVLLNRTPPIIEVPETVKNRHRVRRVPLNGPAEQAVRQLVKLAAGKGSELPEHHLIPFRVKKGTYDPKGPASPYFIRSAFRSIARLCGLKWVTPTTFRHQAITKLLESGAPDETVRAIAGQVSEKAMRYYSHIRIEAKTEAVRRLEKTRHKKPLRAIHVRPSMLVSVKAAARRLEIPTDAALELILEYERSKTA
jgi:integrase